MNKRSATALDVEIGQRLRRPASVSASLNPIWRKLQA